MNSSRKLVIYVGRDAALYYEIARSLRDAGFCCEWVEQNDHALEELIADWYRVLLLDVDGSCYGGLETLRGIKAFHANIPVVLMVSPDFCLTQVALARLDGAEALVLKPLDGSAGLVEILHDAFRRLDRWQEAFERIAARRDQRPAQSAARKLELSARLDALTDREREVMNLLVEGKHTKAIAAQLDVSPKTVEHHRVNILKKMQVESVVELVREMLLS